MDWSKVLSAPDVAGATFAAQEEQRKFVSEIRKRESTVSGYIIFLEGRLFTCADNMQWRRDFEVDLLPKK